MLDKGWAKRAEGRVVSFTAKGEKAFGETFGVPAEGSSTTDSISSFSA